MKRYLTALLAVTVASQSAPQFEIVVEENLPVLYQASNTEITPGLLIPRNGKLNFLFDVLFSVSLQWSMQAELGYLQ